MPGSRPSCSDVMEAVRSSAIGAMLTLVLAGCGAPVRELGSRHTQRVKLPPDLAAKCFARNAEEHSGALLAEVTSGRDHASVTVRVKNGVVYAAGEFRRAGGGSTAVLELNVTTSGRRSDLVDALLAGC